MQVSLFIRKQPSQRPGHLVVKKKAALPLAELNQEMDLIKFETPEDFRGLKTEDQEWARIPGEKIYVTDHSMKSSQLNKVKDINQDIVFNE